MSVPLDMGSDTENARELPAALSKHDAAFQASNAKRRKLQSKVFYGICVLIAMLSVIVLVVLLVSIGTQGSSRLTSDLLTNAHSELEPEKAGMWPAIIGSLAVCVICALTALPLGIGTAIFLEEFKPTNRVLKMFHGFIQLNIANLAGVPSIVYGLLGLSVFVYMFNIFGVIRVNESNGLELFGVDHYYQVLSLDPGQTIFIPQTDPNQNSIKILEPTKGVDAAGNEIDVQVWVPGTPKPKDQQTCRQTVRKGAVGGKYSKRRWYYFRLPLDKSFIAAGLTLALVILPVIIISAQEALRGVSPSLREASLGLGATTWQTTRNVCLPAAIPGMMTGAILAMGRAIGEAAPILIVLGASVSKTTGPQNAMDTVATMPILIYNWAGRPQDVYQELAAAAIIVLLLILLVMNSAAIFIRQRMQRT